MRERTAMEKIIGGIAVGVVVAVVGLCTFVVAARSRALSPTDAELRANYMLPSSKIIEIGAGLEIEVPR